MKRFFSLLILTIMALFISGCSGLPSRMGRIFIDSTTHGDDLPSWASGTKQVWEDSGKLVFKGAQIINGHERVNAGCTLAKLNAKEALLSEISHEIKTSIDQAQQSISEEAELLLGHVRTAETAGKITGLRFTDVYFERYLVLGTERISCYVKGVISKADYNQVKRSVLYNIALVDPALRKAVTDKQVRFFEGN